MKQDEAAEADAIADLVNSLAMSFGDPERFHVNKDLACKRLRRMARRIRGDAAEPKTTTTTWRPADGARERLGRAFPIRNLRL